MSLFALPPLVRRGLARRLPSLALLALAAVAGGCYGYSPTVLGAGGRPVASVRSGTAVDLRFAAPRRLGGAGRTDALPDAVIRVAGTVHRASGDTLVVDVAHAAPLGGDLRPVSPAARVPVIVDRDVAVEMRRLSRGRTALLGLLVAGGVAAAVAGR